jgi:hypothetical protein
MKAIFEGRLLQCSPRNRWEDAVRKDANQLPGIRSWRLMEDKIGFEEGSWRTRAQMPH